MYPVMNAIDLAVADMDKTIAFYAMLGLDFKVDANMPDHASCDLPNGMHLMLDTEPFRSSYTPGWNSPASGSRTFFAFEFPAPAEVDTKFRELTDAGATSLTEPWDTPWGMRYATVLDPDGNGVDLYAPLPST
ncbi:putative lactoylglutathione lyase [Nonomuraea polychroma]|uniref:Putative lactoylglutathione lyase n=1 Tax=Nonomuraea polychroma TaxID=46176 RepID=A0A438M1Q3_9ACTN|nr:VOC family protein [Nonomuraea polychroma]RVX39756.1 putative lactoylglutathione lyase [Nonomuraea polychroma]